MSKHAVRVSAALAAAITEASAFTVLFVGLKLAHEIAWGWLWVVSPIWITLALYLVLLACSDA